MYVEKKEQKSVTKYHEASSEVTGNGCLKVQILTESGDYFSRRTSHSSSCGRSDANLWIEFHFWAGVLRGSLLSTCTDVGICKSHLLVKPTISCVLLVVDKFFLRIGPTSPTVWWGGRGGGGNLQTDWCLNWFWTPFNLLPKEARQGLRFPASKERKKVYSMNITQAFMRSCVQEKRITLTQG